MNTNDVRCAECGKLLAKMYWGAVELKCPKCKTLNKKFVQLADVSQVFKNPHQK